jgi:ABC-type uncharacterized transport system permease subunit
VAAGVTAGVAAGVIAGVIAGVAVGAKPPRGPILQLIAGVTLMQSHTRDQGRSASARLE